jgi:hypothetical protein
MLSEWLESDAGKGELSICNLSTDQTKSSRCEGGYDCSFLPFAFGSSYVTALLLERGRNSNDEKASQQST